MTIRRLMLCVAFSALVATTVTAQEAKPHALPKDPKAAVIELDYKGGMIARKSDEPHLKILADGTVILGDPYGMSKRIESKITPEQLQGLLRTIIDKNELDKFTEGGVKAEIQKLAGPPAPAGAGGIVLLREPIVMDAPTTIIRVNADGKEIEAKYYALFFALQRHPEIKGLKQFDAAEKQLRRGMDAIYAGGPEKLQEHLAAINAKLKADHPDVAPLTRDHLAGVALRADGTLWMSINRIEKLADGQQRVVNGTFNRPEGKEAEIMLNVVTVPGAKGM